MHSKAPAAGPQAGPLIDELKRELDGKSRDLTEALEYQTAVSEVLRIISSSPNDAQPVFDTITKSVARLCKAVVGQSLTYCHVFRFDGGLVHLAALHGLSSVGVEHVQKNYPMMPGRGSAAARSIVSGTVEHIPDVLADPEYTHGRTAEILNYRSIVAVPMLKDGHAIGAIAMARSHTGHFPERQIELLRTFADQAVIAIENTRLFEEVQARTRELTESLEYQTATSDVLNVISRSPTDIQPVLDTIAKAGARLCEAEYSILFNVTGDKCTVAASNNAGAEFVKYLVDNPVPLNKVAATPRAALEGRTIHVHDVLSWTGYDHEHHEIQRLGRQRTVLSVPLMRDGRGSGVLTLMRSTVRPFNEQQVKLAETFADQAVIAIENARLFEAEQESKRELQASLEYQTATGEVLDVISRSPTDVQPVFDMIAQSAARLCGGLYSVVFRFDGEMITVAADSSASPQTSALIRSAYPAPPGRVTMASRALLEGRVIALTDAQDSVANPAGAERARAIGYRAGLSVPMLKGDTTVGAINVVRREPLPFTDTQIELLKTFADQAVIAIENTRLFEEVQARTRELQEAFEYQTATSDALNVISRSPTDVQPVFDMIAESAWQLCEAQYCFLYQFDGELLHFVAHHGLTPQVLQINQRAYPAKPGQTSVAARAVLKRSVVQIPDVDADPEYALGEMAAAGGYKSAIGVPILRDGAPIGAIALTRAKAGMLPDRQVELLKTFADQAVIAIENTRLFEEVQARTRELAQSVEELRALGDVSQAVNSILELESVLSTIVAKAVQLSGTDAGTIYVFEEASQEFQLRASYGMDQGLVDAVKGHHLRLGETVVGQAALQRKPVQLPDVQRDSSSLVLDVILRAGFRALLAIPLFSEERIVGSLVVRRKDPGEFPQRTVDLLQTFGAQSVLAIQNARLFEEIARKSRELEIASQHKSQFVANMSHELRTPLAAILGYAELMQEGFYEPLGQKSIDALTRIRSNGKHLLGLINTVLDIAKIESGQFSLNLAEYALDSMVETVRVATESLAETKKLSLKAEVAKKLPVGLGDEQRLTQVLLNLVGNAIKFTDTGEVRISATAIDGHFTVAVTDTGPGIPPEELKRVFEQFHQIDNSNTKAKGGTGLGLAIAKQIVEMHGGRIWVESTLGKGATFQMELPVRAEFRNAVQAS